MLLSLNTLALLVPLCFLLAGLYITVVTDPYISRKHRIVMLIIIALCVTLIAQNLLENYISAGPGNWFWRTTAAIYGYTLRPVFLILFLLILRPEKKYIWCWVLAILNFLLQLTAYFSRICFWIDSENHFHGGPLTNVCLYISILLLLYCIYQSLRGFSSASKKDILIPLLVLIIIPVSVYLDSMVGGGEQPITFLTFAIVIASMFYYIWLHLRFVREHEADLRARQRIQIMMSQIQPHFMFNTLTSIRYLCEDNPEMAGIMTEKFTQYLRGNMEALSNDGVIPFEQELEHTRIYLEIEKVRFEEALQIVYDITCTEFELPALTLQPIVENAVRHGIRKSKKGSGTVTIATREYPDHYEITVDDNGAGFDPEAPEIREDGREHIGITNVKNRLNQVVGGDLSIETAPGEGTLVTITIPKK